MLYDERDEIVNFKKRDNYQKLWDPIHLKDEDGILNFIYFLL